MPEQGTRGSHRIDATPQQHAEAVRTVMERLNPVREPELHSTLFDLWLKLQREGIDSMLGAK